ALQLAHRLSEDYPDGVYLVELAALTDPGLVAHAVANILETREQPRKSITETIAEFVASKRMLLVLDNVEHLLDACAQLSDALLRRWGQLAILVTSREHLGVVGELTYQVPTLSVRDARQDTTPETIAKYESARLFVDRARLQQPGFAVTAGNTAAVAAV